MKKILIAYYTQSGQVKEILDHYLTPFKDDDKYELFYHQIKPVNDYPFPWTSEEFFDVFPESVTETGCELHAMPQELIQEYDLIIIGVQVWYLSPSIPITAFLKSSEFKTIAKNTSVITINGCRNMWFKAHDSIVKYLQQAQAKHKGHLVLFDKNNNLLSVITVMYWAFTAKKDKMWGVFPKPGIADKDIKGVKIFGQMLKDFWQKDQLDLLQGSYIQAGGITVLPHMMSMEYKAKRIFKIWTKLVLKKGGPRNPKRSRLLSIFKYYLLFMIYFISPIVTLFFYITYPLFYKRIKKKMLKYQKV
jgi:menaquinone-dependent protoporphyrinogen IX oxidase